MYYKELTVEKDKRIDQLNLEILQLKEVINLYENNNQINRNINSARIQAPVMIHTPKSINHNSFISNSGFNLDLSSRLKLDKDKIGQAEINSERLSGGNSGLLNYTSQNVGNGKKLNSTSSSFLIRQNQVGHSIKNTKSFFGTTSQMLSKENSKKCNYFGVSTKNSERKNSKTFKYNF
jgi:hypothetical protein